jgi:hypothetical protein
MKKLICKIFGHKYKLHRKITSSIREVKCTRCKQLFGMNDDIQTILPLDWELKFAHDLIQDK